MSSRTLSITAIGLWVVLVVGFAVMFVRGQTVPSDDGRTAILLTEPEREAILSEMRHMLETVHAVTEALARDDIAAAGAVASRSGIAAAADMNPQLMTKLPLDFKQFGMSVHKRFDDMAAAAQDERREQLLGRLADQLSSCVACHSNYRLQVGGE